jgi:hypothetical protein
LRQYADSGGAFPLNIQLEHLKRIRSTKLDSSILLQIIICPEDCFDRLVPEDLRTSLNDISVVNVPRFAPHSRSDFEEWGQLWPIQFRPSEVDRAREQGLDEEESARLSRYMQMLDEVDSSLERETGEKNQGVIVVNPANGAIITTSLSAFAAEVSSRGKDAALAHPLHTPVMRCINDIGSILVHRPSGSFIFACVRDS